MAYHTYRRRVGHSPPAALTISSVSVAVSQVATHPGVSWIAHLCQSRIESKRSLLALILAISLAPLCLVLPILPKLQPPFRITLYGNANRVWAQALPQTLAIHLEFHCYLALLQWLCDFTIYPTFAILPKKPTWPSTTCLIRDHLPAGAAGLTRGCHAAPNGLDSASSLVSELNLRQNDGRK